MESAPQGADGVNRNNTVIKSGLILLNFTLLALGFTAPLAISIIAFLLVIPTGVTLIYALVILIDDPLNRRWDIDVVRTPNHVFRWAWRLSADGQPVREYQQGYMGIPNEPRGDTETKFGAIYQALLKRRSIIQKEKATQKGQDPTRITIGGRRENRSKPQQKGSLIARYFAWIERVTKR
jgi:hypothetical protein